MGCRKLQIQDYFRFTGDEKPSNNGFFFVPGTDTRKSTYSRFLYSGYSYLGLEWQYEFVTDINKPPYDNGKNPDGQGTIYAVNTSKNDSLEELAKKWNFGKKNENWDKILEIKNNKRIKVKKSKVKEENCRFDITPILPEWYRTIVGTQGKGNCRYSAAAFIMGEEWVKNLKYTGVYLGARAIDQKIYMRVFMPKMKEVRVLPKIVPKGKPAIPDGEPGDIINHYSDEQGHGHAEIYLGFDRILKQPIVFRKFDKHPLFHIGEYKSMHDTQKQYRRK